jgi:hypothetical protein
MVTDTKGQMPPESPERPVEILGDPDAGMDLRESVREQLLRQQRAVQDCERGQPLEVILQQLVLE